MTFRPDIEGLRAVAVLLVVAAHFKVPGLAGGFVGVDVFFVLSGYLITGLLLEELRSSGRIDLARFYARRVRRLFPSLLLVLLCTGLLGRQLLAVGEQPEQAQAAASAALWLSNFHFALSSLGYFAPGAETNLFLHTWSLGVEEQFYLAWPALLLLLHGLGGSSAKGAIERRLRIAMLAIAAAGFVGCVAWTGRAPLLAFYMMPARAWQFALGATALLLVRAGDGPRGRDHAALRWIGWLGLAAILAAAVLLDGKTAYPGAWAALPSLGAAAVLASGAREPRSGAGGLLSLRPMQAIGGVSYVWYLWHWPALLLGAAVLDAGRPEVRAGLALLSLALAFATHVWVEAPLRSAARFPWPAAPVLLGAIAMMIGAAGFALRWHNAAREDVQVAAQQPYERARLDAPAIYAMGCDDWYRSDAVRVCAFGPADARRTAVAIGDSVGLQWFPALEAAFVPRGWRLLVITKSSCPMVDQPFFYARIGRRYEACERWRAAALQYVARQLRPDVVVMGSSLVYDFDENQWRDGTRRVLKAVAGSVGRVFILGSTPTLPFDGPSCLAPRGPLYGWLTGPERCAAPIDAKGGAMVRRALASAAAGFSNASLLDLSDAVCPGGICRARREGMVVFRDNQHVTATFARALADELARRLGLDPSSH